VQAEWSVPDLYATLCSGQRFINPEPLRQVPVLED
jgi:hypothetical protein